MRLGAIWATFLIQGVVVWRPGWTHQEQRQIRKLSKLHKNTTRPIGACSQNPERRSRRPIPRSQFDTILKPSWTSEDQFTTGDPTTIQTEYHKHTIFSHNVYENRGWVRQPSSRTDCQIAVRTGHYFITQIHPFSERSSTAPNDSGHGDFMASSGEAQGHVQEPF